MVGILGLEPRNPEGADLQSAAVAAVPYPQMPFSSTLEVIVCAVPCGLTYAESLVKLLYYLVSGKILRLNKNLVNVIHPTGRILSNFFHNSKRFSRHDSIRFFGHSFKRVSGHNSTDFLVTTPSEFLATTPSGFLARRIRTFAIICESNTRYITNALKFARKKPGNAWLKIQVVPPPGFEPGTY